MAHFRKLPLAIAFSIACAGPAAAMNDADSDFYQTLARHYDALARVEQAQGDTRDARTYALRATAAAAGQATDPDAAALRQPFLREQYLPELSAARERLVGAFGTEARTRAGSDAATAQAAYDCWLEQAQEDLQPEHIAACRNAFETAMSAVDQRLAANDTPPPAPAAPEPAAPPPAAPSNYLVFFDFDRAELTSEGRDILQGVVNDAQGAPATRIVATGHADTAGSAAYNERLSARRARTVREALNGMNMPVGEIQTNARGETEPLVPTGDGVKEPQNRRVEITVER